MDPFIGEIRPFGFDFAPRGWAQCNGQLLPIQQYSAVYALLGVQFGGDGRTTFGLPNLQSRVPMGAGAGSGLTPRIQGQSAGTDTITLTAAQIPTHTHTLSAQGSDANQLGAAGMSLGKPVTKSGKVSTPFAAYAPGQAPNATLAPQALPPSGSGAPHENDQPYQVLNYCIALMGIFPPRA